MPLLTAAQLALLRTQGQRSTFYLFPVVPATVFSARVNDPAITIGAYQIPYDNAVGSFADIEAGMTLWCGTAPNTYNVARIRVRSADASEIIVAENSDIQWSDNLYLTVKREFLCWSVRQYIAPPTIFKDYDIPYVDQTDPWGPVAMLGDNAIQIWESPSTNIYFDAGESYAVELGAGISSYLTDFDDGSTSSAITPGNHAYAASGVYYPTLTVTDSNGKTHLTRRIAALPTIDQLYTKFECNSLEGNIDGGWSATFSVRGVSDISEFPDRAPIFFFAQDYYGDSQQSVGFPIGRENIILFGYIQASSVALNPETNECTFTVESLAQQMDNVTPTPAFVVDDDAPNNWEEGIDLTIFRSMVYLLKFQSTVFDIADVALYNDTTPVKYSRFPEDTLWNMLAQFAEGARLLRCGVSRTGRLQVGLDPNILPIAARGVVPVVCRLAQGDWRNQITAPQVLFPQTSFICSAGVTYSGNPADEPDTVIGMSPGHPPKEYGTPRSDIQSLAVNSQAEINAIMGAVVGQDNNIYGPVEIPFNANWTRCFDPAFQEYIQAPLLGFPTERGLILANQYLIVRGVSIEFQWPDAMQATLTCEVYSYPDIGVNGDCYPADAPPPPQITIPPITGIIPPPPPVATLPTPTNFTVTPCDPAYNAVTLDWTPVANADGYKVERDSVQIAVVLAPLSSYINTGLAADTSYTFRVRAYKAGVNGGYSSALAVTTCLAPVLFHDHAILFTENHVLEWSAFGGVGIVSDVPIDIKGNVAGPIVAARPDYSGQNRHMVIANNLVWVYTGGSTWTPSQSAQDLAQQSGAWSFSWFNEDGTGPHGTAWWGGRQLPCAPPHTIDNSALIHWNYLADNIPYGSVYAQLIGDYATFYNGLGPSVLNDCSQMHVGLYKSLLASGVPTTFPAGELVTPPVFDKQAPDAVIPLPWSVPQHYSPYEDETYHNFVNNQSGVFAFERYLDNVDVSATFATAPIHVTDDSGDIWNWTFDGVLKRGLADVLSEADLATISGLTNINIQMSGGLQALNVAPGTLTRRLMVFLRPLVDFIATMWTSDDDGATWTVNDAPDNGENIFTVEGEPDNLYVIGQDGQVYTSNDEGAHWWTNFSGVGEHALGFWVDPAS